MIDLNKVYNNKNLHEVADFLKELDRRIGFKVSSRGWAYLMEDYGLKKSQFDRMETLINKCRKRGFLPVDFTAEESARAFHEVHTPSTGETHADFLARWLEYGYKCENWYDPDWWEGEEYYIQMIVEKIDLVTLFRPVCRDYHVPIANTKGWSSIMQRAEYARRFKEAEEEGKTCVLLYCGDHDPDGLRISESLRKNIEDVSEIYWSGGRSGYDPENLIIDRFGLNYDFIIRNGLSWIENLETGGKGHLARVNEFGEIVQGRLKNGKPHPNFKMRYMQDYLRDVGVRKCEANSLVAAPEAGRELCTEAIEKYLGPDALDRFEAKKEIEKAQILEIKEDLNIDERIKAIIKDLNDYDNE
jgi:hypothetical protein